MAKKKLTSAVAQEPQIGVIRSYEIMFILPAGTSDKDRKIQIDAVKKAITDQGAKLTFEDLTWGERQLMYRIQGHDRGYYGVFVFEMDCLKIKEMESILNLDQHLIRFLVTQTPDNYKLVKYVDVKEHYDVFPEPVKPRKTFNTAPREKITKKENPVKKDIKDKKLDEVLSEEI